MRSAIDRTFDLIEAVAAQPNGAQLNELAKAAGLSKPTAHRLLADMIRRRLAWQDPDSSAYFLSMEIAMLGFRHLAGISFFDLIQPELDRLARIAGELVRLSMLDGDRLVIAGESQGARPGLRFDANLGRPVVLHTMAVGKVYLASLPREQALALVRASGQLGTSDHAPNAMKTLAELETDLGRIDRQGFALAYDEADLGAGAVAVPIQDGGRFFGGLAIVVPTARWTRTRLGEFAPVLHEAAGKLAGHFRLAPYCRGPQAGPGRRTGAGA